MAAFNETLFTLKVESLKGNIDQLFVLIMGTIVMLMQCGFAFLEAGAVRSKNATNILIKNMLDSFVAGIIYWLVGYAVAYGEGNSFIGWTYWASYGLDETKYAIYFFQYTFAATAATIVSGALAERCDFTAYMVYSVFITGFIYPVVSRWAWHPQGWLLNGAEYEDDNNGTFTVTYEDYAGSGALHSLGGVAALVGAIILGPRKGRFDKETRLHFQLRGHSLPFLAFGGFILIFGFLAFNGGSNLVIADNGFGAIVSISIVNTIIAGSVSAIVSLAINKLLGTKKWSLLSTLNGTLTGMVSVCSGCNVYVTWNSAIMGFIAAFVFILVSKTLQKLYIDDPLDAVAVHLGGGILGVIGLAFFKPEVGILFAPNRRAALFLGWQIGGLVAIITWTAVLCIIMFGSLRLAKLLRVSEEYEEKGLDIPKHGETAYPVEAYGDGWKEEVLMIADMVEAKARKAKGGGGLDQMMGRVK